MERDTDDEERDGDVLLYPVVLDGIRVYMVMDCQTDGILADVVGVLGAGFLNRCLAGACVKDLYLYLG